jgi:hypothetical protein
VLIPANTGVAVNVAEGVTVGVAVGAGDGVVVGVADPLATRIIGVVVGVSATTSSSS